eukprot:7700612-Pyramimonas_sp.AAC.1
MPPFPANISKKTVARLIPGMTSHNSDAAADSMRVVSSGSLTCPGTPFAIIALDATVAQRRASTFSGEANIDPAEHAVARKMRTVTANQTRAEAMMREPISNVRAPVYLEALRG